MKPGQYWTETWGVTSGCTPVSAGCANCWASDMAKRFPNAHGTRPGKVLIGFAKHDTMLPIPFSEVVCHPDRLGKPLHWVKPRVVFVSLMGDLFHKHVPEEFVDKVLTVIADTPQHTYLFLTKRPGRMGFVLNAVDRTRISSRKSAELQNVWLGVSVENQATADERIPILLDTPAAHYWLSAEPLLGPLDLTGILGCDATQTRTDGELSGIEQVIVGCESGPKRRHAETDWFASLRDQCADAGVPYYLKQMEVTPDESWRAPRVVKLPLLDGVRHASLGWEV